MKLNAHAEVSLPVEEDGKIIPRLFIWDGSRQELTIIKEGRPEAVTHGPLALSEFKQIVCSINI